MFGKGGIAWKCFESMPVLNCLARLSDLFHDSIFNFTCICTFFVSFSMNVAHSYVLMSQFIIEYSPCSPREFLACICVPVGYKSIIYCDRYLDELGDHSLILVVKALSSQLTTNSLTTFDFLLISCQLRARSVPFNGLCLTKYKLISKG